jgi:hypothetical protein
MKKHNYIKQSSPEIPVKLVIWMLFIIGIPIFVSIHKIHIPDLQSYFGRVTIFCYIIFIFGFIYEIIQFRRITLYMDMESLTIKLESFFSGRCILNFNFPLNIIKHANSTSAVLGEHGRFYSSISNGDTIFWEVGSEAIIFNQKKHIRGIALSGKYLKYFVQLQNSEEISEMINQNLLDNSLPID